MSCLSKMSERRPPPRPPPPRKPPPPRAATPPRPPPPPKLCRAPTEGRLATLGLLAGRGPALGRFAGRFPALGRFAGRFPTPGRLAGPRFPRPGPRLLAPNRCCTFVLAYLTPRRCAGLCCQLLPMLLMLTVRFTLMLFLFQLIPPPQ